MKSIQDTLADLAMKVAIQSTRQEEFRKEIMGDIAALQSEIECERVLAEPAKQTRDCYCVFDDRGYPEAWTSRVREIDAIKRICETKNLTWNELKGFGYTVARVRIVPIVRAKA